MKKNIIHKGDCLEVLKSFPDECVDIVITSPPYNKAGYEGKIRKAHPKDSWKKRNIDYNNDPLLDFKDEEQYRNEQVQLLNELVRVLKPDGSIFYNHKIRCANNIASHPIEWILKSNAVFRQEIVWDRASTNAFNVGYFYPTSERIWWLTKQVKTPEQFYNNRFSDVWRIAPESGNPHPAPFPKQLVGNILYTFKLMDNAVILDPYAGSGTTLVVAQELGFDYVGIEMQDTYIQQAEQRLNNQSQSLFADNNTNNQHTNNQHTNTKPYGF